MSKTPEEMTDEELEAAQREADGDTQASDELEQEEEQATEAAPEGEEASESTEPGDGEQQQQAPEGEAKTAVADEKKPAGVASKDGEKVLPYGALQAARRDARRASHRAAAAEAEAQRLKQELEDIKAGKTPPRAESEELTEEDVKQAEEDFPDIGAKMRKAFEAQERAKAAAAKSTQEEPREEVPDDDPVQEAIDQVPLLVEWQTDPEHAEKFARAAEHDALLAKSPKWRDKSPVDRFKEAARRTAEEFDLPVPDDMTSSSAPSKSEKAPDPKKLVEAKATKTTPNTLSDLKGGSVPDHGVLNPKMPAQQMLGKFMGMTDDEIDRQLARLG